MLLSREEPGITKFEQLNIVNSSIGNLNLKDFGRGAFSAIFISALITLAKIVSDVGFDFFTANWHDVGNLVLKAAITAFVAYMGTALVSDKDNRVLGKM